MSFSRLNKCSYIADARHRAGHGRAESIKYKTTIQSGIPNVYSFQAPHAPLLDLDLKCHGLLYIIVGIMSLSEIVRCSHKLVAFPGVVPPDTSGFRGSMYDASKTREKSERVKYEERLDQH